MTSFWLEKVFERTIEFLTPLCLTNMMIESRIIISSDFLISKWKSFKHCINVS